MNNPVSNAAARRAGSAVRRYMAGEITEGELDPYLDTIVSFRSSFSGPLGHVHNELADIHKQVDVQGTITHRLKKSSTILNKLVRVDGIDLSRMQDIGGCRSVVRTMHELTQIKDAILASREAKIYDYAATPRTSGYRAVHLVVKQEKKPIEIQLRTLSMHAWAETVEAFSSTLGENYKQDGDSELQEFLRALSDISAVADTGVSPPQSSIATVDRLRPVIQALLPSAEAEMGKENEL